MNAMEHSSGDMTEVFFSVSISHTDEIIDEHFNDSDSAVVQCDAFGEMGAVHHFPSKMCSGRQSISSSAWMVSLAVSESAQKNGGDSHHTICRAFGTTISISSMSMLSFSDGST